MSQCPKCGAGLKEDYGMVTCPSCGAILFVDMDGSAHIGDEPEASVVARVTQPSISSHQDPTDSNPSENSDFQFSHGESAIESQDSNYAAPQVESQAPTSHENIPINSDFLDMYGEASPPTDANSDVIAESHPEAGAQGDASFQGVDDHPMLSEEDPLGLNGFANSELSAAKDGLLMCRIMISGIDTKEIRESLRAAMDDARFNWEPSEILSRLKRGHLTMENITPVKASILINRIKQMPLRIRWEQYTIAEADETPHMGSTDDASDLEP